jgi:hypothetical protein
MASTGFGPCVALSPRRRRPTVSSSLTLAWVLNITGLRFLNSYLLLSNLS